MQPVLYIESVDQATALLKPRRIEILERLDEPRTCPELAAEFGESAHYFLEFPCPSTCNKP